MANTSRLALPLLDPAQAQKHVTVNEALVRIDALAQLSLVSVDGTSPPGAPSEGDVHSVGAGASGAWGGQDGRLAVFLNNGWEFVSPVRGWRGYDLATGTAYTFDGVGWIPGFGSVSANGAAFVHRTSETDHTLAVGATSYVANALPANSVVYGVTGRVLADIGGATSFEIGVSGSTNRYGSGFGVAAGAWTQGITGSPLAYYSATDLVLTSVGGSFDGTGVIRLAVHYVELTLPRS